MRRIFGILFIVLLSAVLAVAQGNSDHGRGNDQSREAQAQDHDDHNDSVPVQSGYAVVTPVVATTSGTATGLVVFETFGMRGGGPNGTTQAGVLPPDLTTNSMLFVDSSGHLSKNLGVAIVNPNGSDATVSLTLRKNDGTPLATSTLTVPSHKQTSKFMTELFTGTSSIPSDVTGTLAITSAGSSNLPVSVIGLRFRGSNFSTLPATNLAPVTTVPSSASALLGAGAVLLPQFAANGGWSTELVLVNTNSTPMNVRVDLYKQDGTPLTASLNGTSNSSFTGLSIPANGVLTLAPRDKNGDDDF